MTLSVFFCDLVQFPLQSEPLRLGYTLKRYQFTCSEGSGPHSQTVCLHKSVFQSLECFSFWAHKMFLFLLFHMASRFLYDVWFKTICFLSLSFLYWTTVNVTGERVFSTLRYFSPSLAFLTVSLLWKKLERCTFCCFLLMCCCFSFFSRTLFCLFYLSSTGFSLATCLITSWLSPLYLKLNLFLI